MHTRVHRGPQPWGWGARPRSRCPFVLFAKKGVSLMGGKGKSKRTLEGQKTCPKVGTPLFLSIHAKGGARGGFRLPNARASGFLAKQQTKSGWILQPPLSSRHSLPFRAGQGEKKGRQGQRRDRKHRKASLSLSLSPLPPRPKTNKTSHRSITFASLSSFYSGRAPITDSGSFKSGTRLPRKGAEVKRPLRA